MSKIAVVGAGAGGAAAVAELVAAGHEVALVGAFAGDARAVPGSRAASPTRACWAAGWRGPN